MKSKLLTKVFWTYAVERAIKAASSSALTLLSAGQIGVLNVDYTALGSVAGLAALVSVLDSLKKFTSSAPVGEPAAAESEAVEEAPVADAPRMDLDATQEVRLGLR